MAHYIYYRGFKTDSYNLHHFKRTQYLESLTNPCQTSQGLENAGQKRKTISFSRTQQNTIKLTGLNSKSFPTLKITTRSNLICFSVYDWLDFFLKLSLYQCRKCIHIIQPFSWNWSYKWYLFLINTWCLDLQCHSKYYHWKYTALNHAEIIWRTLWHNAVTRHKPDCRYGSFLCRIIGASGTLYS